MRSASSIPISIIEAAAIGPLRILLAAALAALAAPPLLAAKPPAAAEAPDTALNAYREQGIALCVADLRIVTDLSGDDLGGICGCALGRFMDGRVAGTMPPLSPSRFRGAMESELLACTAELRPDRTREVAGRGIEPPDAAFEPQPAREGARAARREAEDSGFDPVAWLRGLDLRARFAALPAWAWFAIGFLILLLLAALVRRRDDRRDLLGPPPSMRPGAGAGQPAPRRPDLPRPFRLEL